VAQPRQDIRASRALVSDRDNSAAAASTQRTSSRVLSPAPATLRVHVQSTIPQKKPASTHATPNRIERAASTRPAPKKEELETFLF
jgi:hypothetical protein